MSLPCGFSSKSMDKTKKWGVGKSVPEMCKNVATWSLNWFDVLGNPTTLDSL